MTQCQLLYQNCNFPKRKFQRQPETMKAASLLYFFLMKSNFLYNQRIPSCEFHKGIFIEKLGLCQIAPAICRRIFFQIISAFFHGRVYAEHSHIRQNVQFMIAHDKPFHERLKIIRLLQTGSFYSASHK